MPQLTPSSFVAAIAPPRFLAKLKRLDIKTVADLLGYFPLRYEDRNNIILVRELVAGERAAIRGAVKKIGFRKSWGRYRATIEAVIADQSGEIRAFWFNQPYVKKNLPEGREAVFYGKILSGKKGIFISNPAYETVKNSQGIINFSPRKELLAIYPETKGLTSKGIRFLINKVLPNLEKIPEFLPEEILKSNRLPEINQAFRNIHFPKDAEEANAAKKRFAFEELFLLQLNNLIKKAALAKEKSPAVKIDIDFVKNLLARLPYTLTFSQKRSLYEILRDLEKPQPMNRLLQGDVGSGKTVVAAIAALETAKEGYQSAFMAPTEILAGQHYETFKKFFAWLDCPFCLLTSKLALVFYGRELETEIKKKKLIEEIESGKIKIIIGTHSLIAKPKKSGGIKFANLGLVVVDEQHRFGVRQRQALATQNKADYTQNISDKYESALGNSAKSASNPRSSALMPHFLSMSATPIPRTLAITIFGDLDLSTIDELPKDRKPIITKIVDPKNRAKAYAFIRGQIRKGRQVFVVCPRIEPTQIIADGTLIYAENSAESASSPRKSASWDTKTVKEEFKKLSGKIFPDLRVTMLHGKMKAKEKQKTMSEFKSGGFDVLVSTSVVEVGVDVPNASIMMIEGAERFGLAQLYQFRGRVGRGERQSFCFLFTGSSSETVRERLKALLEAKNGFELAEKDLKFRGPGEFLGTSQTGLPDTAMRALQNPALIKTSREAAKKILAADPSLNSYPALKAKLRFFRKEIHLE
jgi:ATP-dependent DNA helicase RecG